MKQPLNTVFVTENRLRFKKRATPQRNRRFLTTVPRETILFVFPCQKSIFTKTAWQCGNFASKRGNFASKRGKSQKNAENSRATARRRKKTYGFYVSRETFLLSRQQPSHTHPFASPKPCCVFLRGNTSVQDFFDVSRETSIKCGSKAPWRPPDIRERPCRRARDSK